MSKKQVVLLGCGSYNPITNTHLRMFELAKNHLNSRDDVEVIGGIVSPTHDWSLSQNLAPAFDRCSMCQLALENTSWIQLDSWEVDQAQPLPTSSVLDHFDNYFNGTQQDDGGGAIGIRCDPNFGGYLHVMLLCGEDILESFGDSNLWNEAELESILRRGMVAKAQICSKGATHIHTSDVLYIYKENIYLVHEPVWSNVTSTKIRRAIRRHRAIRTLVPDSVINYIYTNNLYIE